MQTVVKRPQRVLPPPVPEEEVRLEPPPDLPREANQEWWMNVLPMLGMAGSAAFFFMPGMAPFMRVVGGLMIASTVAMIIVQLVRARQGSSLEVADARRDYLKYLAQIRKQVRRTADRQRSAQLYLNPGPDQLWAVVADGRRLWERRPGDQDFLQPRVGLGTHQLATPLRVPETAPRDELEPLSAEAMQRFIAAHGSIPDMPIALSLRSFYHVAVTGDADTLYGAMRAMVCQLATLHSPDDLIIAVAAAPGAAEEWEWTKWLPHVQSPSETDGAGSVRLIRDDLGELERILGEELSSRNRFTPDAAPVPDQPHVVVVLDGGIVPADSLLAGAEGLQGVTVVELLPGEGGEPRGGLTVDLEPGVLRLMSATGTVYTGVPDELTPVQAEALARQLAPLRLSATEEDEPLLANLEFTDLMGVGDAAAVDVSRTWRPRLPHDRLRVPIGVGENGEPVMLDLKEASQEGMGPHGLCVGATGSGKSELLRTLVLGLAMTHSSETLNFVLADFKGGATFAGMADMPHVAAVITNLADDLTLVDRMRDSITGELTRRQELLRAAGNYANIHDYERARAAGAPLEPLPSLVIIIDEFSELLTAKPEFIDMFIQIGRIGRSLGVHLLLASQRLEEGRLRGLDTYLSYRIGLRTFSAAESRAAIGAPDAYHLPSVPGSGYLKFDTDTLVRFKAAYVSGPYREAGSGPVAQVDRRAPVLFTAAPVARPAPVQQPAEPVAVAEAQDSSLADTVLDVIVSRLQGQGPPAHQVWLPPLNEPPTLDHLLPGIAPTPNRGLAAADYPASGRLVVPLGIVDKPFEQRRDVMYRDFSGAAGHALIIGGPQSGKSTLLRTLIGSFALTHTPAEAQFYCLDFGGGGLLSLQNLPHVGGVASRMDVEMVRRLISEVHGVLSRREELFRSQGIDSMNTFRRMRAEGRLPQEPWGDVFLVVDGWMTLRQDFEDFEPVVTDIATRGLGFGVHVVLSISRYAEVRPSLKDQIQTRIELRLGDPVESEIDRKVARTVPQGAPGRGLSADKLHFLAALPRIDGVQDASDVSEGVAALVARSAESWAGPRAPRVRMLPELLPHDRLPKIAERPELGIPFGVDETELAPVYVDFVTDPHFVVFGDSESGKTALLRVLMHGIMDRYTPAQAQIILGDYRRASLGVVPDEYLLSYAAAQPALSQFVTDAKVVFEERIPGPDVTQEQLRNRSWWRGPEIFYVIDDYDLVATSSGNPLSPLVDILPFAKDVGLHLVLARRTGGAGRAMFEPIMQRLKELGVQGVVLSGDRDEGALLGNVRAQPRPPGRGVYVARRGGNRLVQTAWLPPR
ncbi:type VII secretion protein EccCa [Allostreptomyces psammosilenae]|uniref:S-DNA-T family DNA segregation ATPase FtsK/SpoIIIE n=1 Tax=Allostreptomyces psammosilenae TaxID=1892865 RepID=A0A853ADE0_9ACTN|nr:type VII secretion protein EccCa [Allostreptomyces psammosilenae]NYI08458.1 S-DNA-T family DNA segregation ATPase FtsK/SpoIIIE [Allostreptomyces psammosilenae]